MGKKGKYSPEVTKKITDLIKSDDYTDAEICKQAGISHDTYYRWINEFEEFAEAIRQAKAERLQLYAKEAKKSLLKKIQGYTANGKHYAPDTTLIIFTLTNTEPEIWRNRHSSDISGTMSHNMSKEAAAEVADLMQKFLKTSENADKH